MASRIENGDLLNEYLGNKSQRYPLQGDLISEASSLDDFIMDKEPIQQRLYIINRSGSGEAQFVLLNQKRTSIESYGVRYETWKVTKGISNFGVAVVENVLYVIGGYDVKTCKHLHRVVK
ncbi:hypothetical protein MAR_033771 [Mya arenaria]|uniref:Uncharacterized protein n=2 Tax=Mya arenaria TaxID=6604 RepID=A0ABY7GCD7_MYAAR|nr:hypothetical protein MAR_033771 [Mya arenaria]